MKRFVLAPEAVQDLNDIWEYIAEDSLDAADRFLRRVRQLLFFGVVHFRWSAKPGARDHSYSDGRSIERKTTHACRIVI